MLLFLLPHSLCSNRLPENEHSEFRQNKISMETRATGIFLL
ncbi:hypothetical protein EIKCOROL_02370 [Eikenella corrodens ATCC 23834]|uniref:Uncharacterized protein n=1 Tax=Eikenella corrodens ATCC 23834 TaxID=546274 RepID=C0DYA8_EIKCO|nr:hypothetical protein EIKCOROL_02370 [Eikenella corrodens ATCC 23834]